MVRNVRVCVDGAPTLLSTGNRRPVQEFYYVTVYITELLCGLVPSTIDLTDHECGISYAVPTLDSCETAEQRNAVFNLTIDTIKRHVSDEVYRRYNTRILTRHTKMLHRTHLGVQKVPFSLALVPALLHSADFMHVEEREAFLLPLQCDEGIPRTCVLPYDAKRSIFDMVMS